MSAIETIISLIINKVAVMNIIIDEGHKETDAFERFRHELVGMMICLRNINNEDKFYCVDYNEDHMEFGYYDGNGKWIIIK